MRQELINYKDYTLKRVSKRHAYQLFKQGTRIFAKPCNINSASPFCTMWIIDEDTLNRYDRSFEGLISEISCYNCNNECGNYLSYYIENEV